MTYDMNNAVLPYVTFSNMVLRYDMALVGLLRGGYDMTNFGSTPCIGSTNTQHTKADWRLSLRSLSAALCSAVYSLGRRSPCEKTSLLGKKVSDKQHPRNGLCKPCKGVEASFRTMLEPGGSIQHPTVHTCHVFGYSQSCGP